MTPMPASRSARATTFAPRSWPSRPGLATTTRIRVLMGASSGQIVTRLNVPLPRTVRKVGPSARTCGAAGEFATVCHIPPRGLPWVRFDAAVERGGRLTARRVCVPPRQVPAEYRGRRRVPQPARSRYVAVVTTAIVGAGVVVCAGAAIPDAKMGTPYASGDATTLAISVEDRQAALDRASRTDDRGGPPVSVEQAAPDVWLLPLHQYTLTTLFEMRWGEMHTGLDMAIGYGTPYMAAHAGTVIL